MPERADGAGFRAQRQRARQLVFEPQRVGRDGEPLLVDEREAIRQPLADGDNLILRAGSSCRVGPLPRSST